MPILMVFYKAVVIAGYRTVSNLTVKPVATTLKLIILAPLLLMMLVLVAIHLLDFCPSQLFGHSLFLQYWPSINANLIQKMKASRRDFDSGIWYPYGKANSADTKGNRK